MLAILATGESYSICASVVKKMEEELDVRIPKLQTIPNEVLNKPILSLKHCVARWRAMLPACKMFFRMDYHRILAKLYVGSRPESASDIEHLKREIDITAVLNLQTDDDMRYFKLEWDSMVKCYQACGIELHRSPIRDFDSADLQDKLPGGVSILETLLESGHTVYLHCSAGAGRSPTVAIAYLCWRSGWGLDQALAHVVQCRPCSPNIDAIRLATKKYAV